MITSPVLFPQAGSALAERTEPLGATPFAGGVRYRVWAPDRRKVVARIDGIEGPRELPLTRDASGYFSGEDNRGRAGDLYRFALDDEVTLPDPASRFQPQGVEGPSCVVDPAAHVWRCADWTRPPLRGRVIYELHIGTFTREGTFSSAIARFDELVDLGVNTIELMPLADFPGDRNWGYDGVMPYAPARCYGQPDELRALLDAAHERGLAVILDVVYNHLGPSGNVLPRYAAAYFHAAKNNIWGRTLNFGEPAVRAFFVQNACMWLDEYRFDGLRLDAVHAIEDDSETHIVAEIAATAHERGAFVIAEDERNEARLITPTFEGGWGLDGVWADDFHHTTRVALTRQRDAHFASFEGTLEECARTLREGWLYTGQIAPHRGRPRGTPAAQRPPEQFVVCISNHDQVGNRPLGERLHDSVAPEAYRALSMLFCLTPYTPMLFMGQEWAAGAPFLFFTDHSPEVGDGIAEGRRKEFAHYGANYDAGTLARMPDPQDERTFAACKLDWDERERPMHAEVFSLYRTCLRLRASTPVFQNPPRERWTVEPIGENLLGLRWTDTGGDWLLLVGLAPGLSRVPEHPLLRLAPGHRWRTVLASNAPEYGGEGSAGSVKPTPRGLMMATPGAALLRES